MLIFHIVVLNNKYIKVIDEHDPMPRSTKSVSLETDLLNRVEKETNERGGSFSDEVNRVIRNYYQALDSQKEDNKLVECDDCGAEYSTALDECPGCEK